MMVVLKRIITYVIFVRTIYLFPKIQYANSVLCATFLHKTLPLSEWMLLHSISYAYLANSLSFGAIKKCTVYHSISLHQCVRSATHTSAVFKAVEMFPSKPGRKRCQYLNMVLKRCCISNAALYSGTVTTFIKTVCKLGCLLLCRCSFWLCFLLCQMLLHSGRQAGERCRLNTIQFRAVQVFSLMYLSLWRWIGSRHRTTAETPLSLVAVPEDDPWWPVFLSPAFLFLLSSSFLCAKETKTQRKSIRPISWQKPFHFFDCASSFVLSLGVGSRDTMGGSAIKGLLLEWSLLYS